MAKISIAARNLNRFFTNGKPACFSIIKDAGQALKERTGKRKNLVLHRASLAGDHGRLVTLGRCDGRVNTSMLSGGCAMSSIVDAISLSGAPVLAVCGFSGSGKTTLLEAAIPRLVERGLAVAVVKHGAHGYAVDRAGKDSERLFRAGATIVLSGPEQQFERRAEAAALPFAATLARLGCDHDLVLVEGHKDTALPKFWLAKRRPLQCAGWGHEHCRRPRPGTATG